MKGYIYMALMVVVLAAPFVVRRTLVGGTESSGQGGGRRLIVVTPHNPDIRREFAVAFDKWHRERYGEGAIIDYRSPGGTNDIQRLLETSYRSQLGKPNPSCGMDVVWGGGDFFFEQLRSPRRPRSTATPGSPATSQPRLQLLEPIVFGDGRDEAAFWKQVFPEPTLAGLALYRCEDGGFTGKPMWVGVCLSSFGIAYNADLYESPALGLPEPSKWTDLTNPKLSGYVAMADPTHSGSAANAYLMIVQRAMADAEIAFFASHPGSSTRPRKELERDTAYRAALDQGWKVGQRTLLRIAANARYFTDAGSQPVNDVGNGEAAAAICIDFFGRVYQESVGERRCKLVTIRGATAITPDPVAILKGGNRELALRFVDFLLSPSGQKLWSLRAGTPGGPLQRNLRRLPIRQDCFPKTRQGYIDENWVDPVNPFEEAAGFNQRTEWASVAYRETQMIWAAAWIDSRDILRDSYQAILAVPDAGKRESLCQELSDIPVSYGDVRKIEAERKAKEERGEAVDEWRARTRLAWANRFREHYRTTANKAKAQ